MNASERVITITARLCKAYPDRAPLLTFSSPYELAIAVILSAQTTDAQVNRVTPGLFARFPTAATLADADQGEIESIVRSTGFYRNKAKNIIGAARVIRDEFGNQLPESMEDLTSIPGMGRKSANVIRGVVFGEPSIVVDTHLTRVSNRLGLVNSRNPAVIERELKGVVPPEIQTDFSMSINLHGRYRCLARTPDCRNCELRDLCPYPAENE
jgi:endonuclease III